MKLHIHLSLLVLLILPALTCLGEITVTTKDATCHGKKDGEANISVSVEGNFEYTVTGAGSGPITQTSGNFTGLEKGDYEVVVKDTDTECEFNKTFTIDEPDELKVDVGGGGTSVYCNNQSPQVILTASGSDGTAPYTYSWPDGQLTVSGSGAYICTATDKNGCTGSGFTVVVMIPIVCSRDPNDMVGPEGVGPEKWVAKNVSQPYTIRFENDPDFATAPAQQVRINQKLDKHLNLYSLRLGDFGFGDYTFSVPPNKTYYSGRLTNIQDSLGVLVDVTAGIDVNKGEAFWIFKSVNPTTGLEPDAGLGFLLVNDSLHRGEGFVSYTVKPANNTVTGDSIHAIANIVFDSNEAILTPEIFNTIDASPPESHVNPVPAEIQGDYTLTASSSDVGSGMESYDLFISENDKDFKLLASHIPIDSGYTFHGEEGSHYAVYSIARDMVGNLESPPSLGDVTFSVRARAFVRLISPSGGDAYCMGDTITIQWKSNHIDKINLYYSANSTSYTQIATEIEARDSSYQWVLPLTTSAGKLNKILIRDSRDSSIHHVMDGIFAINRAPVPVIVSSGGQAICHGDSTILSIPSHGFKTYHWSTAETTAFITATHTGIYKLTATDFNGCIASDSIEIEVYPAINRPVISAGSSPTFCAGNSVELFAPEGFPGYQWSRGDTTRSIRVSNPGDYSVSVTTAENCKSDTSEIISVVVHNLPERPLIEGDGLLTICEGDSVTLFAPMGFDKYLWSTGDTTRSITVSRAGSYTVSVVTADGCSSAPSNSAEVIVVPRPTKPQIEANGPLSFCEGGSVLLSAPFGFHNYSWSTGDTTQTINAVTTGKYSVSVGAGNGCTSPASDEVTVNVSESLPKPVIEASGPLSFCEGGSVTLSAPTGYQEYVWSTGETTRTITVSSSGTYSVRVSMHNGACLSPASDEVSIHVLNTLPKPVVQANGPLAFCEGGSVVLSAPLGYPSYVWSTGDTTRTITVLHAGNFSVTVSTGTSCVIPPSDKVVVTVYPAPPKPIIQANGPLTFCEGGSLLLSAPGNYKTYLWSTGEATEFITVMSSANISVTVTDLHDCRNTSELISVITADTIPPSITVSQYIQASVGLDTCGVKVTIPVPTVNDNCTIASVVNNYTHSSNASGIFPVGTTNVIWTVTDVSGNTATATTVVTVIDNVAPTLINCPANISAAAPGPVTWIPPTASDACGIASITSSHKPSDIFAAGTTTVAYTAMDNHGNIATCSFTVTVKSAPLTVTLTAKVFSCGFNVSCKGATDGKVTANVTGGYAPYTYLWTDGQTGQTATLGAGTFGVTVTDSKGETKITRIQLTAPQQLSLIMITSQDHGYNVSCNGASDGSAEVKIGGGCGPYRYQWSNGQSTAKATGLKAGLYTVQTTDANGCWIIYTVSLSQPTPLTVNAGVKDVYAIS